MTHEELAAIVEDIEPIVVELRDDAKRRVEGLTLELNRIREFLRAEEARRDELVAWVLLLKGTPRPPGT